MISSLTSADGTRIAFERIGHGQAVVLVGGLFCDRQLTHPLAERLAEQFSVTNYDRRGRGDSGDSALYAVERELEDLAALIGEAGGHAHVYGHSSGAGLALRAAAAGLAIDRLVLHEPPYSSDDEQSRHDARTLAETIRTAVAEDRRADAITTFFSAFGLPPDDVAAMTRDPKMLALAPTMPYDFEVMGEFSGGGIPEPLVRAIQRPTLAMAGGASPEFFRDIAARIATLLPNGHYLVLEGAEHTASAEVVARVVATFLASRWDDTTV